MSKNREVGKGPHLSAPVLFIYCEGGAWAPFTYSPREQSSVQPELIGRGLTLGVKAEWKFQIHELLKFFSTEGEAPGPVRAAPHSHSALPICLGLWDLTTHSASPSSSQWEDRSCSLSLLSGHRLVSVFYSFWGPVTLSSLALWEGVLTAPRFASPRCNTSPCRLPFCQLPLTPPTPLQIPFLLLL